MAPSLARVVVDLGAVRRNYRRVLAAAGRPILAVVKADAYGHGASEVAAALVTESELYGFAVARLEEALALRGSQALAGKRIVVLSPGFAGLAPAERVDATLAVVRGRLTPVISSSAELLALTQVLSELGDLAPDPIEIHLEVDTGMARAGVAVEEVASVLERIRGAHGLRHSLRPSLRQSLRLSGLMSHFAESEKASSEMTARQRALFAEAVHHLDGQERAAVALHVANSAAALYLPETAQGLVRVGGALYGLDLAARRTTGLEGVMRVESRVLAVRDVASGTPVGYGQKWVARGTSRIALVAAGYADGYPSVIAGASALVGGVLPGGEGKAVIRAPVVGAVSMDLLCLDVTGHPVEPGDRVVLLGDLGQQRISAFDLADWSGQVPYEVTCGFSRRLERTFLSGP